MHFTFKTSNTFMKLTIAMLIALSVNQLFAQTESNTAPILFIYDASGSMWGQIEGKTKKEIASEVLSSTINSLPDNQGIGLIAYGHRSKGDCQDVEYLFQPTNRSKSEVISVIETLNPLGKTPLAYSANMAINSLQTSGSKATIILITDGIESCDGNICDVISAAKLAGLEFKMHIVGLGLKESEIDQLTCAAAAGGGRYYDASDARDLSDVLTQATSETIDDPKGNFSVFATKNGKAVDAWVKVEKSETMQSISGSRTYKDTAWVNVPSGTHQVIIKPLEGSDIPATSITIEIKEGDRLHRDISFDGGSLKVLTTNNSEGWDAVVKMIDQNSGKVAATTRTYGRYQTMEVAAGTYKVTFQALAMKGLDTFHETLDVQVKPSDTITISHNFVTGIAMVGVQTTDGELVDATVNFHEVNSGKNVAASRTYTSPNNNPREFLLNPGNYRVTIVTLGVHKGKKEILELTVSPGETIERILKIDN
ncbi:MAG: hypothetical protein DHS20C17_19290 [Cyclobacteriaceae bacterium]|nr:MAG: hypothetical protein DHS20C17_19290 [Cyclobacteriaceae bacterium]